MIGPSAIYPVRLFSRLVEKMNATSRGDRVIKAGLDTILKDFLQSRCR